MRHGMRSAAARTVPALAMPPIIIVPAPVCAGNGSCGGSYRSAATAADGSADDCAGDGASCRVALRKGIECRCRGRKGERKQYDQAMLHSCTPKSLSVLLKRRRARILRLTGRLSMTLPGQCTKAVAYGHELSHQALAVPLFGLR